MPRLKVDPYCDVRPGELLEIASSIRKVLDTHPLRIEAREELQWAESILISFAEQRVYDAFLEGPQR